MQWASGKDLQSAMQDLQIQHALIENGCRELRPATVVLTKAEINGQPVEFELTVNGDRTTPTTQDIIDAFRARVTDRRSR